MQVVLELVEDLVKRFFVCCWRQIQTLSMSRAQPFSFYTLPPTMIWQVCCWYFSSTFDCSDVIP